MSKKTRKKSKATVSGQSRAKTAGKKRSTVKTNTSTTAKKNAVKKATKHAKNGPPFPVRTVTTLAVGDTASVFLLPRDGGQSVALASFAGRKLAIFFYPRADTPGCTREAMDFSRLANAFSASQTAVLGVSADPLKAQERFRDKHQLTVPLVSDEKLTMLKEYGTWSEKSMYGKTFMGVLRTTVLIDRQGKIARIWRNVKVEGHADEVLAAAQAL
ncbi:MAG: peroxiredoxin [Afipia sp.]|nr:peroxiredoxin [Afipia sp.]